MRPYRLLFAALALAALAVPAHAGLFRHRRAVAYPSSPCAGGPCPAPAPAYAPPRPLPAYRFATGQPWSPPPAAAPAPAPAPAPQPPATPLYHPVLYRPMPAGTPYVGEDGPPVRPSPQSGPTGGLPEPEPAHHRRHHGR
jgi:hypothetical protein